MDKAEVRKRVTLAFRRLRGQGFVARQSYWCCTGCAQSAYANLPAPGRGLIFYHKQDANDFFVQHYDNLFVRYSCLGEDKRGARLLDIGRACAAALRGAGLAVEWNEKPTMCIGVTGISDDPILNAVAAEILKAKSKRKERT